MAFKTLSLKEAGQFDKDNNLKEKLTGWGMVSKDRQARGISRRLRRLAKKSVETN